MLFIHRNQNGHLHLFGQNTGKIVTKAQEKIKFLRLNSLERAMDFLFRWFLLIFLSDTVLEQLGSSTWRKEDCGTKDHTQPSSIFPYTGIRQI